MRQPVDILVDATVDAVAGAGVAEAVARMGTVAVVDAGGTVTVTLAEGDVPKVRLLGRLYAPTVGDMVEVLRTRSGWVCLGPLATSSAPKIQSGTVTTPTGTDSTWITATVTFPKAFSSTPRVVMAPNSAITTASTTLTWSTSNASTTGFTARCRRSNSSTATTPFDWIATNL
ncbi:H-type lectin domain-containing protein [Streptomyces sp. NPDC101393]|uniref:H-type lectin domain-containing protein n=1 Tax=Streptomyces sp. NPDC101393 TaxID=3366141 RepID=UPI0038193F4B